MFTFLSSGKAGRIDGHFDDNGENVGFYTDEERSNQPKPSGIITEWVDWDLDEYLAGHSKQRIYRWDAKTGKRDYLLTKWEDHGQLAVVDIGGGRLFVTEYTQNDRNWNKVYLTDADGSHRDLLWEDGFTYGFCLSPDKKTMAYHYTCVENDFNPAGCAYSMNTLDLATGKRCLVHSKVGHLMFGSAWTPDGKYVVFQDCFCDKDPAHYFSDICIAKPDGSEVRYLTENQSAYFGTAFGSPEERTGGSNYPVPISDTEILYTKRTPDGHPDAKFCPELGNHHENVFAPENARGGGQILLHNIETNVIVPVTKLEEGKWDFRPQLTPDKKHIIYTSVRTGENSCLRWIALDGTGDRFITKGYQDGNADHAHWCEPVD